ncbi:undecaprenyl-diphosphate phosphatase [Phytohabitans flavus]|uniref:undecaprenyl-diphosphate phosphatase n=1 Tax=Phytohabitans flavus TaxID=1076124 RepID=UPI00363D2B56
MDGALPVAAAQLAAGEQRQRGRHAGTSTPSRSPITRSASRATGVLVSFVVAYASIAWLLRYVSRHSIVVFAGYRVALGLLLAAGLVTGALSAT